MAPYIDDMSSPRIATVRELTPGPTAGGEQLDDLFDYDVDLDDVFRPLSPLKPIEPAAEKKALGRGQNGLGLGIDEEVEVTKKQRAPRVKLDENRLLSQAGIPKLRKKAKTLKFKGKGHEYSDAARLLTFYQLWLDDLFPKAKFLDALAMIEKLGHKKRIQLMRMEWINEGKPKPTHEDSIFDDPVLPPRENIERVQSPSRITPMPRRSREGSNKLRTPEVNEEMDDIYDATPMAPRTQTSGEVALAVDHESPFGLDKTKTNVTDEPQDDLDALLAEQEMEAINIRASSVLNSQGRSMGAVEHEADELEALAEMEEMW